MLKCLYTVSPRLFHIRAGVGTCKTPIGNWGLINDLCRLVPAPPISSSKIEEEVLPIYCSCVVCFYYVRRSVLFKFHIANIEASKFLFFCR